MTEYYPYKWVNLAMKAANLGIAIDDDTSPSADKDSTGDKSGTGDRNSNESNVEKWILVAFCSICILAMIVCIIVLIIYKVRKSRRQR